MAEVKCPHCGQLLDSVPTMGYRKLVCPMCAGVFSLQEGHAMVAGGPSDSPTSSASPGWSATGASGESSAPPPPPATQQGPPEPPKKWKRFWSRSKSPEPEPEPEDEDDDLFEEPATPADEEASGFSDLAIYGLAAAAIFLVALIGSVLLARYVRTHYAGSLALRPDRMTQQWIRDLQHSRRVSQRRWAAESLVDRGTFAVAAALKATTDLARDGNAVLVSDPAINALSSVGVKAVMPVALCLESKDPAVRAAAAQILANYGPEAHGAVNELAGAVDDSNRVVRWNVIRALGQIGPDADAATDELVELLAHHDRSTRRWAIRALGSIGPPAAEALDPLVRLAVNDDDPAIRRDASLAVERINLKESSRVNLEQASEEVRQLVEKLADDDPHERVGAARQLGNLGPDAVEAVPELTLRLGDSDKWMREAAATALGKMGRRAVVAIPVLRRATRDPEPEVVRAAEEALREIGDEDDMSL